MANINFNVDFKTFINWYLNVSSVDEITPELLKDCGLFDMSEKACKVIKANYNNVANVEIIPDKMTESAKITFKNGNTLILEVSEIDTLFAQHTTDKKHVATYRGRKLYTCNVFGRVLYCSAIWEKYPEFFVYCANYDAMTKQIDFVSK